MTVCLLPCQMRSTYLENKDMSYVNVTARDLRTTKESVQLSATVLVVNFLAVAGLCKALGVKDTSSISLGLGASCVFGVGLMVAALCNPRQD